MFETLLYLSALIAGGAFAFTLLLLVLWVVLVWPVCVIVDRADRRRQARRPRAPWDAR